MPFRPNINDTLTIDGTRYQIAEHPAAPGMPYGQTGRRATVYQLISEHDRQALKVFTLAFRVPRIAESVDQLQPFASLPGLGVCNRRVLTPACYDALLAQQPDLTYAVLMPWVAGSTWQEVMLEGEPYTREQSHAAASALIQVLAAMEQRGAAHCDLSGPNVMVTDTAPEVALIDVEDMYGPGLTRPEKLPAGSVGYAHQTAAAGLWRLEADRFAAAVLLAEMLGWCDERVRQAAYDEQFFDPDEMQQDGDRYRLLSAVLGAQWGEDVAATFARAWQSATLADCPPLSAWAALLLDGTGIMAPSLQDAAPAVVVSEPPAPVVAPPTTDALAAANQTVYELAEAHQMAPQIVAVSYARALLNRGTLHEHAGNAPAALADYQAALAVVPAGTLQQDIEAKVGTLAAQGVTPQAGARSTATATQHPAPPPGPQADTPAEPMPVVDSRNGESFFEPAGDAEPVVTREEVHQRLVPAAPPPAPTPATRPARRSSFVLPVLAGIAFLVLIGIMLVSSQ